MKSALFIIEIFETTKTITSYGYNTDFRYVEDSLDSCLKSGKVISQSQTTDIFGKTIISISIQVENNS